MSKSVLGVGWVIFYPYLEPDSGLDAFVERRPDRSFVLGYHGVAYAHVFSTPDAALEVLKTMPPPARFWLAGGVQRVTLRPEPEVSNDPPKTLVDLLHKIRTARPVEP